MFKLFDKSPKAKDISKLITPCSQSRDIFINLKVDIDNLLARLPRDYKYDTAMPMLYVYRLAHAGAFVEGYIEHEAFINIYSNFIKEATWVAQNFPDNQVAEFQKQSWSYAKKVIDLYEHKLTDLTISKIINYAKNGIDLMSALFYSLEDDCEDKDSLEYTCRQIINFDFTLGYFSSALSDSNDDFEKASEQVYKYYNMLSNPNYLKQSINQLFY